MYFPVEMVLMVKALVTFEGVGQILNPGFDVKEVSQKYVNAIFMDQFCPSVSPRRACAAPPNWWKRSPKPRC